MLPELKQQYGPVGIKIAPETKVEGIDVDGVEARGLTYFLDNDGSLVGGSIKNVRSFDTVGVGPSLYIEYMHIGRVSSLNQDQIVGHIRAFEMRAPQNRIDMTNYRSFKLQVVSPFLLKSFIMCVKGANVNSVRMRFKVKHVVFAWRSDTDKKICISTINPTDEIYVGIFMTDNTAVKVELDDY
ncbi:hypothetical protein [Methylosinus sporium]|uniref:hypothetical protein n=1 Tax=Methylosinus sporium TaxID=428 RepID=UPI0011B25492|nr:hypothetical protein [Methylosinus sporium]